MKRFHHSPSFASLCLRILCAWMLLTGLPLHAQTLTTVVNFNSSTTGRIPVADLTDDGAGNLYGTTQAGGSGDHGTIFKIAANGAVSTLVVFTNNNTSNKGRKPSGSLFKAIDGFFYGTTFEGGAFFSGTVFRMSAAGVLQTLASFNRFSPPLVGSEPTGSVIAGSDGSLYGLTSSGGSVDKGTLFKITGTTVTSVFDFDRSFTIREQNPFGSLLLASDGNFYGLSNSSSTPAGAQGSVFKITPAGVPSVVVNFTGAAGAAPGSGATGSLIEESSGFLYGTTFGGGTASKGTIFKVRKDGTGFTTMVNFNGVGAGTNNGAFPWGSLLLANDGNFYGTTEKGGLPGGLDSQGLGTVFRMTPSGTLTTIVQFTDNGPTNKGAAPRGSLIQATNGNLYGTTTQGGINGDGTVFKIALTAPNTPPVLNLPASPLIAPAAGPMGAIVNFTVTATDAEDDPDPTPTAAPPSGSVFAIGDTTVNVNVTDGGGLTTTGNFIVRVQASVPTVTTQAPSPLSAAGTTLRGLIHPHFFDTNVNFILDEVLAGTTTVPAGNAEVPLSFGLSSLVPGSAHTCRLDAFSAAGPLVVGNTVNFVVPGGAPSVVTNAPTMITPTHARLQATVNPNSVATVVTFYVGGVAVGTANVPAGTDPTMVYFDYYGVIPGQSLTFSASAANTYNQTGSGDPVNFDLMASETTMNAAKPFLYGANIGWINARPATSYGFRTGDTVCSGFLYSANVGWLHAGTGEPANGVRYSNTGSDYGVNVMPDGTLRGIAWSGNIGWVAFEPIGNPRIDYSTGGLAGYAYSGNVGWLNLGDSNFNAATTQLAILDTDGDGISDAWETEHTGGLAGLSANHDADGDGISDLDEFIADTNPFNPLDFFKIGNFDQQPAGNAALAADSAGTNIILSFSSQPTRVYRVETSLNLLPPWSDAGLGWFAGSATGTTTVNLGEPVGSAEFYRVAVQRPLSP